MYYDLLAQKIMKYGSAAGAETTRVTSHHPSANGSLILGFTTMLRLGGGLEHLFFSSYFGNFIVPTDAFSYFFRGVGIPVTRTSVRYLPSSLGG